MYLWHSDGKLKLIANYTDDKLDGLVEEWYDNGQLWTRVTYKDGKLNGLREWWQSDGSSSTGFNRTMLSGGTNDIKMQYISNNN